MVKMDTSWKFTERVEKYMVLFHTLCHTLDDEGWDYEYDEKNELIRFRVHGVNTDFNVFLIVDEEQESLLCNTYITQKISKNKRADVCEFMNRVNYELDNGNLEMDMDDGEIRYRTFLDLSDTAPSKEQILNLIWNGPQCFDTYFSGLMKMIYNNFTPEEAANSCLTENMLV